MVSSVPIRLPRQSSTIQPCHCTCSDGRGRRCCIAARFATPAASPPAGPRTASRTLIVMFVRPRTALAAALACLLGLALTCLVAYVVPVAEVGDADALSGYVELAHS